MAMYSDISVEELNSLLSGYSLGKLQGHKSLAGGQANSSFRLTTDTGDYTLSICDEKNPHDIEMLTALLVWLEKQQYPSSRLIRTVDGRRLLEFQGKPVYVKEYIQGEVVEHLSENMLVQVGEKLAHLHSVEPHPLLPTSHAYGLECFDDVIQSSLQHPFVNWLSEKRDFLVKNTLIDLPKGFIHGDLFYDNLLFSKGSLVAVLDFEEACHFAKVFDLGMTVIGCCVRNKVISMKLVRALVSGYQQVRAVEQAERNSLPIYIQYAAIGTAFWRFRQYYIRNPDTDQSAAHLEMQDLADQIHAISQEDFLQQVFT
jgi:homoserine kinase type II